MDLYEAIEITERWLTRIVQISDYYIAPSEEEYEAIKICMEAAREQAGV